MTETSIHPPEEALVATGIRKSYLGPSGVLDVLCDLDLRVMRGTKAKPRCPSTIFSVTVWEGTNIKC